MEHYQDRNDSTAHNRNQGSRWHHPMRTGAVKKEQSLRNTLALEWTGKLISEAKILCTLDRVGGPHNVSRK